MDSFFLHTSHEAAKYQRKIPTPWGGGGGEIKIRIEKKFRMEKKKK